MKWMLRQSCLWSRLTPTTNNAQSSFYHYLKRIKLIINNKQSKNKSLLALFIVDCECVLLLCQGQGCIQGAGAKGAASHPPSIFGAIAPTPPQTLAKEIRKGEKRSEDRKGERKRS